MENYLLDSGFSHVWSKLIPYLLTVIFGLILAIIVYRRFKGNKKLAIVLSLFFLIVPFIGYFAVNPIYEGDFGINGKAISIRNAQTKKLKNGILVLAIPGCPYCMQSISTLKVMKNRKPEMNIDFSIIGTTDSSAVEPYSKEINGQFDVKLIENESVYTSITGSSFPTFILIENGMAIHSWTNNEFGAGAKDKIEGR